MIAGSATTLDQRAKVGGRFTRTGSDLLDIARQLIGAENCARILHEFATASEVKALPRSIVAILERDAPTAMVMDGFFGALQHETRTAVYPARELDLFT